MWEVHGIHLPQKDKLKAHSFTRTRAVQGPAPGAISARNRPRCMVKMKSQISDSNKEAPFASSSLAVCLGSVAPLLFILMFWVSAETSVYFLAMMACVVFSVPSTLVLWRGSGQCANRQHMISLRSLSVINFLIVLIAVSIVFHG